MRNNIRATLLAVSLSAVAYFSTGCEGYYRAQIEKAAEGPAAQAKLDGLKATRKGLKAVDDKATEMAGAAQGTADRAQIAATGVGDTVKKYEDSAGATAKIILATIGVLAGLRLLGKPFWRVVSALLLRMLPLKPRRVIQDTRDDKRQP